MRARGREIMDQRKIKNRTLIPPKTGLRDVSPFVATLLPNLSLYPISAPVISLITDPCTARLNVSSVYEGCRWEAKEESGGKRRTLKVIAEEKFINRRDS